MESEATIRLITALRQYGNPHPLPQGPFSTIVADPPWKYNESVQPRRMAGRGGQAEHQYSTMTTEQILSLPVKQLAAEQAHLYMWTTNPKIFGGRFSNITAKDIVESWGFRYITLLTWVKPGSGGMGWYFRGQTEHVVFATRGNLGIPANKRERNVIEASRSRHSKKPDSFFEMVERVSPGPYLEMFARSQRPGWTVWGDEVA